MRKNDGDYEQGDPRRAPKKIALIVNSYPPRMGGLEQHLGSLARELVALGNDVTVFTIDDTPSVRVEDGVKVLTGKRHLPVADIISFPSFGTRRRLSKILKEGSFDVVSVHTRFFPMSFVGLRAAKKAGVPVVHTEHGSGHVAGSSTIITLASWLVDQTMGRFVLTSADRVLGVSDAAASFAQVLGASEPGVFFNAIPVTEPRGAVANRPSHLVFVGRVVAGKGWDTFLRAVAGLREQGRDVTGELLGDGQNLQDAMRLADELKLQDIVKVRGRVSPEEVRDVLAGSTLVNPSTLSEGFQTTLLEAIAERGRVVTFAVPSALVLQQQGAPVVITAERTLESLLESLRAFLDSPPPLADPSLITYWTWPTRAVEFKEILEEVTS